MKKFIAFLAIFALLAGCGRSNDKGELVGVKGKKWHPEKPFGMSLVVLSSWVSQTTIWLMFKILKPKQ